MKLTTSLLTLLLLIVQLAPLSAQPTDAKSTLRVLFVGHDPEAPQPPFRGAFDEKRTKELYSERTAAFSAFLKKHFEHIEVVHGADYEVDRSKDFDVTIFDARPKPIIKAVRDRDPATGQMKYAPPSFLPDNFPYAALTIAENSPRIGEAMGLKLDWL